MLNPEPKVLHVVADGGPCSGKTTGLARAKESLEQKGVRVLVVPEAATLLINGGITPWHMPPVDFQRAVFDLQLSNESVWQKNFERMTKNGHPTIFLYDRALLSGAAYLGDRSKPTDVGLFEEAVINPSDIEGLEAVRSRYDGVIHLVTAADGAEEFYTTANNTARKETPEEARVLDEKTQAAWLGHPHLRVIPNVGLDETLITFDQKMADFEAQILHMLGLPVPVEIEDKYLLGRFDPRTIPVPFEVVEIEQDYLVGFDEERVRKRVSRNFSRSFYHTIKIPNGSGGRIELEKLIRSGIYETFLTRRDEKLHTIRKSRYCFLWNNQYFEVDVFHGPLEGLFLCEREKTNVSQATFMPPFLGPHENVTSDERYTNRYLATLSSL